MLTIDGATPRQLNRVVNTSVPHNSLRDQVLKQDDGIPAELRRAPEAQGMFGLKPAPTAFCGSSEAPQTSGGMIFLRRSGPNKHWVYMFTGIKHVQCGAELDVPVPCGATLRDVLEWLGTTYGGKLGGAWLLVAP